MEKRRKFTREFKLEALRQTWRPLCRGGTLLRGARFSTEIECSVRHGPALVTDSRRSSSTGFGLLKEEQLRRASCQR
jgi:hypothetical protein